MGTATCRILYLGVHWRRSFFVIVVEITHRLWLECELGVSLVSGLDVTIVTETWFAPGWWSEVHEFKMMVLVAPGSCVADCVRVSVTVPLCDRLLCSDTALRDNPCHALYMYIVWLYDGPLVVT